MVYLNAKYLLTHSGAHNEGEEEGMVETPNIRIDVFIFCVIAYFPAAVFIHLLEDIFLQIYVIWCGVFG